jgi:hypothetical protein
MMVSHQSTEIILQGSLLTTYMRVWGLILVANGGEVILGAKELWLVMEADDCVSLGITSGC